MKILLRKRADKHKVKYIIDIMVKFSENVYDVASSTFVKHPTSIKKKMKYTDEELIVWNAFIDSVISEITSENFEIIDYYQSKKIYAFYLNFYPVSNDGELLDEVQIRFRIADNDKEQVKHTIRDSYDKQMFKVFSVNGSQYPSTIDVMRAVRQICKCLKKGDYSSLDRY